MYLTLLKSKLHQARITQTEKHYEGSCAIDCALLDLAGIHPHEQIQIYNITNGNRLTTYAITAPADSGIISMNGAAALLANVHDVVIICTYAQMSTEAAHQHQPRLVYLDDKNQVVRVKNNKNSQVA